MRWIFAMLPLLVGLVGTAYGEPLDEINTEVLESSNDSVTIQISWNHDESVAKYEAGCVSCLPNIVDSTESDAIVLHNITGLDDGQALLFLVAYDNSDEILTAKQIIIELP